MPKKYSATNYIKNTAKKAVRKKARKAARKNPFAVFLLLLILALGAYLTLCACDYNDIDLGFDYDLGDTNIIDIIAPKPDDDYDDYDDDDTTLLPTDGYVAYHFIDVGQGDAILITTPEGNILVDTSEAKAEEALDKYLKSAGVESIKYLVLTHPDADHIGNASFILENYQVDNVIMGEYANATTKTFEKLLDTIEEKAVPLQLVGVGDSFEVGGVYNRIIAPIANYKDSNENSLVIRSSFGEIVVMLTGDAEHKSEADIVESGRWDSDDLEADVLKVGHHGSNSSTTEEFLDAVSPKYAVISCGEGNKYGHPHDETIDLLAEKGIEVYRTDLLGTIIFKTDGKTFTSIDTVKTEPEG